MGSWLGGKLSLTKTSTWADIVTKLKGVSLSGTATAGEVLTGETFYTTSLSKVTGTMRKMSTFPNPKSGTTINGVTQVSYFTYYNSTYGSSSDSPRKVWKYGIGSSTTGEQSAISSALVANTDGSTRLCFRVPISGYYTSSDWLGVPQATVASKIGLTAAKILSGNTILGIAGTGEASSSVGYVDMVTKNYSGFNSGTDTCVTPTYTIPATGKYIFILVGRITFTGYSQSGSPNIYYNGSEVSYQSRGGATVQDAGGGCHAFSKPTSCISGKKVYGKMASNIGGGYHYIALAIYRVG